MAQVKDAIAQGHFAAAIALIPPPQSPPVAQWLGLAHLLANDPDTAQTIWFDAIAEVEADSLDAYWEQLWTLLGQEGDRQRQHRRFLAAELAYRQALELEPTPDLCQGLGWALAQQGKYDEAIAAWQEAVVLDPTWLAGYQAQGETHQHLGECDRAIAAFQSWLAQEPTAIEAHHRLGQCQVRQGQLEDAIAHFQQALQDRPPNNSAHLSQILGDLGLALAQQGKRSDALIAWQQALAQCPQFIADWQSWGTSHPEGSSAHQVFQVFQAIQTGDAATAFSILAQRNQRPVTGAIAPPDTAHIPAPTGFYETSQEWAKAHVSPGADYIPVFPPSILPLTPPQTPEPRLHPSFCFGEGVPLPGAFVVRVPQGRYWIEDTRQVAAIAPENRILGDLSPFSPILSPGHPAAHPQRHPLLHRETLPAPKSVDGTVAVLSGLSNHVYFHWLFDVLPRLEILKKAGISWDAIDYFLVDADRPFQQETLHTLGIPLEKTLSPSQALHWQARSLLLPSFPASISWMPDWSLTFLRETFLPHPPPMPTGRRLYISRTNASVRRILNEARLLPILDAFGFEVLHLETLTVAEQARTFAEAEIIVAGHGSGLSNLVFCAPGTRVIEFFSPQYVYPCFWLVANWRSLSYHAALGDLPEGLLLHQALHPDSRQEDLWVAPNTLLHVLEQAGVERSPQ